MKNAELIDVFNIPEGSAQLFSVKAVARNCFCTRFDENGRQSQEEHYDTKK